ncbi:MAG TPA: hypothetical protein VGF56_05180 [Rhizomicrobium sp.]
MADFVTVFNVTQSGYRDWEFPAFGLIFVAVGLALFFFPRVVKALRIPARYFDSRWSKGFRYFYVGFALFWTVAVFAVTFTRHEHQTSLVESGRCPTVTGPVENFVPMPAGGHGEESFTVSGVHFSISDYVITGGFNNTVSHGGPVTGGAYVRICYDPGDNAILTLAIRGYRGPVKDYGHTAFFDDFTSSKADKSVPAKLPALPWWSSVFVYVYLLNLAGILLLYRPYLRVFPALSRHPVADGVLARVLADGASLRLRDTLARWDSGTASLWLRPRGLNIFSIPQVVARLGTDPAGRMIVSREIRYAVGFPVAILLFFATAFLMFTRFARTSAPDTPLHVFLGVFFVIASVSYVRQARRAIKRMDGLAQEAIEELKTPPPAAATVP